MTQLPWYVLRLRSNSERLATQALEARGFNTFLPVYRTRRVWSDRIKEIEAPLFTGYTFCQFDAAHKLPVVTAPGVISIIGSSSGPIPVDDSEILTLQVMLNSGLAVGPWPFLREGESVLVERGPLEGLEGLILSARNKHRLVMSVSLLQRSVSVEIDREWIRPLTAGSSRKAAFVN